MFRYDGDAHERFTTLIEALVEPPRTPESSISDAEGRTLAEAHPTHACSSCEGAETRCRPWIPTVAGLRRLSREARGFAC